MAKASKPKGFDNPKDSEQCLVAAPSAFFDAVAIFASADEIKPLLKNSAALDRVRDAFGRLKVIGHTAKTKPIFTRPGLADDLHKDVIDLGDRASVAPYIETAKQRRMWAPEARLAENAA
jgi:catalase